MKGSRYGFVGIAFHLLSVEKENNLLPSPEIQNRMLFDSHLRNSPPITSNGKRLKRSSDLTVKQATGWFFTSLNSAISSRFINCKLQLPFL
jgi:hypothetical protein